MIYFLYTLIGASLSFLYLGSTLGFITAGVSLFILILWLVGDV